MFLFIRIWYVVYYLLEAHTNQVQNRNSELKGSPRLEWFTEASIFPMPT